MKILSWVRDVMVGAGSIFSIAPSTPVQMPLSDREAAAFNGKALAGDFEAVGGDMRKAIEALEKEKAAKATQTEGKK